MEVRVKVWKVPRLEEVEEGCAKGFACESEESKT